MQKSKQQQNRNRVTSLQRAVVIHDKRRKNDKIFPYLFHLVICLVGCKTEEVRNCGTEDDDRKLDSAGTDWEFCGQGGYRLSQVIVVPFINTSRGVQNEQYVCLATLGSVIAC